MANDSSLLPTTPEPPGQATLYTAEKTTTVPDTGGEVTTTDIEFDYSSHLDRIVTALEQVSLSMAFIADKIDNISDRITNISNRSDTISEKQTIMASLAAGDGIHMKGPLDWVGLVSTYKLYVEDVGPDNVTLDGLIAYKSKIDALPKEF